MPQRDAASVTLRYFSDMHGALFPELSGKPSLLEFLQRSKAVGSGNQLIFGGGDDHGGGSPWDVSLSLSRPYSFAYRLMSHCSIDAFTLGNHDLDWGPDALLSSLKDSGLYPLITNAKVDGVLAARSSPARIFDFVDCRIGTLGFANLSHVVDGALHLVEPLEIIEAWLEWMTPRVDCLAIISHLGNNANPASDDRAILPHLPANAVLLSAHSHQLIPEPSPEWKGETYLQSGLLGRAYGEANWSSVRGWSIRNLLYSGSESEEASQTRGRLESELAAVLQKEGKIALAHAAEPERSKGIAFEKNPSLAAEQFGRWLEKQPHGSTAPTLACLCSRFASSATLAAKIGVEDWYRVFQYADRIASFEIPWSSLPLWFAFNADQLSKPDFDPKRNGFLYTDKNWAVSYNFHGTTVRIHSIRYKNRPYQSYTYSKLTVYTHSFVASGAAGYGKYLQDCEVERSATMVERICLRDALWKMHNPLTSKE